MIELATKLIVLATAVMALLAGATGVRGLYRQQTGQGSRGGVDLAGVFWIFVPFLVMLAFPAFIYVFTRLTTATMALGEDKANALVPRGIAADSLAAQHDSLSPDVVLMIVGATALSRTADSDSVLSSFSLTRARAGDIHASLRAASAIQRESDKSNALDSVVAYALRNNDGRSALEAATQVGFAGRRDDALRRVLRVLDSTIAQGKLSNLTKIGADSAIKEASAGGRPRYTNPAGARARARHN